MSESRGTRIGVVAAGALLVNAVLFMVIQLMVGNPRLRLDDSSQFDIANFIRMAEQSREVRSRRDPKAPEKPKMEQQRDLDRLAQASKAGGVCGLAVYMPSIDIDIDVGGGISLARELTPLVRFPPEYPMAALSNSVEGFVILRFTVTETGSVADPEIVRSQPEGVFDRAAIRSVLRWKYQPQLANGEPVSVVTYTRITFQVLDD